MNKNVFFGVLALVLTAFFASGVSAATVRLSGMTPWNGANYDSPVTFGVYCDDANGNHQTDCTCNTQYKLASAQNFIVRDLVLNSQSKRYETAISLSYGSYNVKFYCAKGSASQTSAVSTFTVGNPNLQLKLQGLRPSDGRVYDTPLTFQVSAFYNTGAKWMPLQGATCSAVYKRGSYKRTVQLPEYLGGPKGIYRSAPVEMIPRNTYDITATCTYQAAIPATLSSTFSVPIDHVIGISPYRPLSGQQYDSPLVFQTGCSIDGENSVCSDPCKYCSVQIDNGRSTLPLPNCYLGQYSGDAVQLASGAHTARFACGYKSSNGWSDQIPFTIGKSALPTATVVGPAPPQQQDYALYGVIALALIVVGTAWYFKFGENKK